MKQNLFYFGLESIKSRYTYQLCKEWIPETFKKYKSKINFVDIPGENISSEIKIGSVLDAVGRGKFCLSQCNYFLDLIQKGSVKDNDIIFLQDFWTPGIESIFYALDLYNIHVKVYSMLHAQSVDEYDFTFSMKNWMRNYELGLDKYSSGIFVGSTIHREQLRQAGFTCPIHVISLPINSKIIKDQYNDLFKNKKENYIIFSSRLDYEKNPLFMLSIAKDFLNKYPDWKWIYTTSASELKSNDKFILNKVKEFSEKNTNFIIKTNLSKYDYYELLSKSKIQINTSLQDYVSWTVIEAALFNCDLVYPEFRSFPEFLSKDRLYKPFNKDSAIEILDHMVTLNEYKTHKYIIDYSDLGREIEAFIIINGFHREINIWHEYDYFKTFLNI